MKPHSHLTDVRRIWRQIDRRRRVQLGLLVLLMFVASVVELFSIGAVLPLLGVLSAPEQAFEHWAMRDLVRVLDIEAPNELLLPVTALFCLGAVASGVARYALLAAQTKITYAIGIDLSVRIFERTLNQPFLVHVSRNSSEVIAGVATKSNELIVSLLYPVTVMVSSLIMLVIVLAASVAVEPVVTLSTVATFTVFYGVVSALSKRTLATSSGIISQQYSNVIRLVQEGLGGIRDILLDGTQGTFIRNYRTAETSLRNSKATVQIMSGTPRFVIETLGVIFIAVLAFQLASRDQRLSAAIPVLGIVALAAQRLIPVMQLFYSSWAGIVGAGAAVHDALNLLEQPMPVQEREGGSDGAMAFSSTLCLEGVGFAYGSGPFVLRGIDVTIPKGARVGIVGETGSGKSTFLDVVMGLILSTEGRVLVDGVTVEPGNLRSWQRNIAHVPQAIYLTDASVAENIAFGLERADIDMARVEAAARTAQVYDVIARLPQGFDTMVGERGTRLSGGQRQRIGIARALYKDATMMVLDEATNALDGETERAVMDAIHGLPEQITLLIVAHRLSTLRDCTSVIRIKDGSAEVIDGDVFRASSVSLA